MSRSLSWIDAGALQDALTRAKVEPGTGRPSPSPRAFRFDVPSPSAPTERPVHVPAPPAAPTTISEPGLSPMTRLEGSLAERLRALAVWIEGQLEPEAWYLADEEGLALHAAGVDDVQVVTAVALGRALKPLRGFFKTEAVQSATLALDETRTLHVLWCDTDVGRVALGLFDPKRSSRETLRNLRDTVCLALNGREGW